MTKLIVDRIDALEQQRNEIRLELEELYHKVVDIGSKLFFTSIYLNLNPLTENHYIEVNYSFIVDMEKTDLKLEFTICGDDIKCVKAVEADYTDSHFVLALLRNECNAEFKEIAPTLIVDVNGKKVINTTKTEYFLISKDNIYDLPLGDILANSNTKIIDFISSKLNDKCRFELDKFNLALQKNSMPYIDFLNGNSDTFSVDRNEEFKNEVIKDISDWLKNQQKISLNNKLDNILQTNNSQIRKNKV